MHQAIQLVVASNRKKYQLHYNVPWEFFTSFLIHCKKTTTTTTTTTTKLICSCFLILKHRQRKLSLWTSQTWRRSQGCDCVARELKWKLNLCPWILRWICGCGYIIAWDFFNSFGRLFWLRCFALSSLYERTTGIQKSRLNQVKSAK